MKEKLKKINKKLFITSFLVLSAVGSNPIFGATIKNQLNKGESNKMLDLLFGFLGTGWGLSIVAIPVWFFINLIRIGMMYLGSDEHDIPKIKKIITQFLIGVAVILGANLILTSSSRATNNFSPLT